MARSRIAAMSASCLLALAATLGSAQAQSAGAPLPLLQIDHAKAAVHGHHHAAERIARTAFPSKAEHKRTPRRIAKRIHAKTRVADAGRDLQAPPATPPQTAPQNDSQGVWPTSTSSALGYAATPNADGTTAALAPSAAPASVTTEHVVDNDPNGILNGAHAVPAAVTSPVTPAATAPQPAAAAKPLTTNPASASPPVKMAAAAPIGSKLPVHVMLFRPSAPSPVGSASWIAQLLAALGGAIAAGAVAWFLIRPAPERNFG